MLMRLLLLSLFLMLTACGGGKSESPSEQQIALDKISAYADDASNPVPTLQDYLDAEVDGVDAESLEEMNALVESLTGEEVDTSVELNTLVTQLIQAPQVENSAPTADAGNDLTVQVNQSITLTGSAADSDGTIISYEWKKGTTVLSTTTLLDYTPNTVGKHTLTFTVIDNDNSSTSDTVDIVVTALPVISNQAPTAEDISTSATENTEKSITLTATDADNDILTYALVSNPANGSVSLTSQQATYTPANNYSGTDSFTYKANDGSLDSNTATVLIEISDVNVKPVVNDINASTNEDAVKTIALDGSDSDGDSLNYSIVSNPSHGSVSISGKEVTYTPVANYNGTDSFTYKANDGLLDSNEGAVSITLDGVNDAPVANNISASTDAGVVKTITLDATDVEGDSLSYIVVDNPSVGTVSISGNVAIYTPDEGYAGTDNFTYKVNDGSLDSNTATVSVTIKEVVEPNQAPVAQAQSIVVDEDSSNNTITLEGTDDDNDSLSFMIVTQPSNGVLTGTAPDVTYTPSPDFAGTDIFSFKVNDGTEDSVSVDVSITVIDISEKIIMLNDTGITTCSDEANNGLDCSVATHPNQDADLGLDVTQNDDSDGHAGFSFTKLNSSGEPLESDATEWSCVKDNVSGLVWEVKTNNDYRSLGYKRRVLSWYNQDDSENGGSSGVDNWNWNTGAFVAEINAATLCGKSNWRLPTREELRSIVDFNISTSKPAIDTNFFPNTMRNRYWTSSSLASDGNEAWIVHFNPASDYTFPKSTRSHVRLVHGDSKSSNNNSLQCDNENTQVSATTQYLKDNNDGTITDTKTGLMWKKCSEGQSWDINSCNNNATDFNWNSALTHAHEINQGSVGDSLGMTGWRVPNVKELASIAELRCYSPSINLSLFPTTSSTYFWSSSPDVSDSAKAWGIRFNTGHDFSHNKNFDGNLRLVREGE